MHYQHLIDRARAGESVAIKASRPDFSQVIDFLVSAAADARGVEIHVDSEARVLWIKREPRRVPWCGRCECYHYYGNCI